VVIVAAAALVLGGCAGGGGAHVRAAQTRKDLAAAGWRVTSLAVPGSSRLCSVLGHHPRVFLSAVAVNGSGAAGKLEVVHLPTIRDAEHCLDALNVVAGKSGRAGVPSRTSGYMFILLSDPARPEAVGAAGPWVVDLRAGTQAAISRDVGRLVALLRRWSVRQGR
jgi:hypothetical protein